MIKREKSGIALLRADMVDFGKNTRGVERKLRLFRRIVANAVDEGKVTYGDNARSRIWRAPVT